MKKTPNITDEIRPLMDIEFIRLAFLNALIASHAGETTIFRDQVINKNLNIDSDENFS